MWSELQIRILNDCKVIIFKNTVIVYYNFMIESCINIVTKLNVS